MRLPVFLAAALIASSGAAQSTITIERVEKNHWRATYSLAQPVTSLRFERPAGFFREKAWTVVTPGYHLARSGEWQTVTLDSNATAKRELVFDFPEYTTPLTKEYELFQVFTDGSVAIYTGHFFARPSGVSDSTLIRRVRVVPPGGTHAIIRGKVEKGTTNFTDNSGEGTYVYIGTGKPIETPDVIAVVDPGMPAWIRALYDANLPKLFHGYAEKFGAKLPWKPFIIFGFEDNGSSGLSSGGGTLTGLINMSLAGQWKTETPNAMAQAIYLIAHESAHLWNGQLVENKDGGTGAWMHEGAADASANEMLIALGIIDSTRYRLRQQEALNRCATAVAAGSVETSISRGQVREAYDCGFMIALWTTAAIRRSIPDATMFTFWRELIREGKANGDAYNTDVYMKSASALGVPSLVTNRMLDFVKTRDSIDILITGLKQLGVGVRDGQGTPPAQYQSDAARAAVIHLMQQACNRVSLTWVSPPKTGAIPSCEPFAKEMTVAQISGARIRDQGIAVYGAIQKACGSNGKVELQSEDGTVLGSVACTRPLAPLPRWFEITN